MNSIASTVARRGIWAGALRRSGVIDQVSDQLQLLIGRGDRELMPAIVAARAVSFDGTYSEIRTPTFD